MKSLAILVISGAAVLLVLGASYASRTVMIAGLMLFLLGLLTALPAVDDYSQYLFTSNFYPSAHSDYALLTYCLVLIWTAALARDRALKPLSGIRDRGSVIMRALFIAGLVLAAIGLLNL